MNDLFQLAKFAGGRFDLVQAGGGNVSWKKPDGEMLIKTSGISLSEMASINQCACLKTQEVFKILENAELQQLTDKRQRERFAKNYLDQVNLTPERRPSIETFLHVMLEAFTLHTHPIAVNHLVIRKDAKKIIEDLFPEAAFVEYATPGIELALSLKAAIELYQQQHGKQPQIVFLKNHGLIVSADNSGRVCELTEAVLKKIEKFLHLNYDRYRLATDIAALYAPLLKFIPIAYLSEDQLINQLLQRSPQLLAISPTSPDAFVFNGEAICFLENLKVAALEKFFAQHSVYPKVVSYQQHIYFINQTVRKAKEMEEVFKFHLMALAEAQGEIESLPQEELAYLGNWEAEHYRQKV